MYITSNALNTVMSNAGVVSAQKKIITVYALVVSLGITTPENSA